MPPPPPRSESPALRGMEKAIPPPKQKQKQKQPRSSSKRESYYTKTAPMYSNKPLPALPRPSDDSSRPSSRADSTGRPRDPALPQPLNIPRRPKTAPGQHHHHHHHHHHGVSAAAAPLTPPPMLDLEPSPVETSPLQQRQQQRQPQVPPRHPARPPSHPRRTSSVSRHAATGHRPGQKVAQLTGYDVDIYDDVRDRFPGLSSPPHRPADAKLSPVAAAGPGAGPEPGSPTMPFPVHGYEPFAGGASDFGSDGTASAAGSRHGSARFSFSSRPSWSSHSPHLSFDGKALSLSRSRDSLAGSDDNKAMLDYHRFASELAGSSSSNRPSTDSRRFSAQSGGEGGYAREASQSNNNRSSSHSLGLGDLAHQRTPFQQNAAPAAQMTPSSSSKKATPPKQKFVSTSFSSNPWTAEEKRRRHKKTSLPTPASAPPPPPPAQTEPRSVFESDSDDEVGITDSIRGFFHRRSSSHQDTAPAVKTQQQQQRSSTNRDEAADKSLLDKAREWRTEKKAKEEAKQPRQPRSNEDLGKWFREKPTSRILS